MPDDDLINWLREEANDWEPTGDTYAAGFRSPTAARLREAADEIERLRIALNIWQFTVYPDIEKMGSAEGVNHLACAIVATEAVLSQKEDSHD
jgi:hypothetical protein